MYTSTHIRRFIFQRTDNAIFSTRECLNFGKRAAVDKCLSRLVKRGEIIRLARGLFKRIDANPLPAAYIIATHKAQVFGKQIISYATNSLNEYIYSISSHSSKFRYGNKTIHFKGISARKMFLGDSPVGRLIREFWHLGQYNCNQKTIMTALASLNRQQRQEIRQLAYIMPSWLADKLFRPERLFSFWTK